MIPEKSSYGRGHTTEQISVCAYNINHQENRLVLAKKEEQERLIQELEDRCKSSVKEVTRSQTKLECLEIHAKNQKLRSQLAEERNKRLRSRLVCNLDLFCITPLSIRGSHFRPRIPCQGPPTQVGLQKQQSAGIPPRARGGEL